jgi:hypothetical protein
MDVELLENQNEDNTKDDILKKRKYTVNSIDSAPEFKQNPYLSETIFIISFFSLLIGAYILYNNIYYLNPQYDFSSYDILYYYIIIYTFSLIGVLFIAFALSLIIKVFSSIKKCIKSKKYEDQREEILIENEDISDDDNFLSQILQNADNISMVSYTFTLCVLLTIILYVAGFPVSWYLIYCMAKNRVYSKFYNFILLYLFIFFNSVAGAVFIFVLIIFIRAKRKTSLRKLSFTYDEDNLMAIYKEVRDAIDLVK